MKHTHHNLSKGWIRTLVVGASAFSLLTLPNAAVAAPFADGPASSETVNASQSGAAPQSTAQSGQSTGTITADQGQSEKDATPAAQNQGTNQAQSTEREQGAQSGSSNASAPSASQPTSAIISAPRAADGEIMNYAVNLAPEATPEQLTQLVEAVKTLGGVPLAQYPALDAFFVQSAKATFASDLGSAAQNVGITLHSVGPTRFAQVSGAEVVVSDAARTGGAGSGGGRADVDSQMDEYVPDPQTAQAWGLTAIGAVEAQKVDVPRAKVTVAVLDTGVDGTHVDLDEQIDVENSVGCHVNGIPDNSREAWQDDHYHGTHVAGTIAAEHNGQGVDGVAPGTRIMAVKASNAAGLFYPEYVTCGIMWAFDKGADITNNSYYVDPWAFWIPTEASQAAGYEVVRRAFEYTNQQGLLHVVAAGNDDYDLDNPTTESSSPNDVEGAAIKDRDVSSGVDIPAMLDSVVTVSSVRLPSQGTDPATAVFQRSGFSNYGDKHIEVAAPGSAILSTISAKYGGGWQSISGTSMASPHVAGVAALLKSIHPDATAPRLRELLLKQAENTMDRLAQDANAKSYRGRGLVNALDAVTKDQPTPAIGELEYSIDGGNTWQPVGKEYNVNVSPKARLRVSVTGPATAASLKVFDFPVVTATSDNLFGGELTVTTEELPLAQTLLAYDGEFLSLPVTVSAEGRNKDKRADDDVVVDSKLALVKAEVVPHPDELKVAVSAASATSGDKLTLSASGFAIGEEITFSVHSDPVVVGTVAADKDGRASIEWTVPAEFPAGTHTVKAVGTSGRAAEQTLEVTAAQKPGPSGNSGSPSNTGTPNNPGSTNTPGAPAAPGTTGSDGPQSKAPSTTVAPSPKKVSAHKQGASSGAQAKGGLASTGSQAGTIAALAVLAALVGAAGLAARKRA